MNLFKRPLNFAFSLTLIFATPLSSELAIAAGGGGHDSGMGLAFLWKVINFAIIAFVLFKVGKKAMPGVLNKRREDVAKALDEAQQRENEANETFYRL